MATNGRTVTVFGGTGFLGRRIVRHLRDREFPVRIASRHPDRAHRLFGSDDPLLQSVEANIHDERSVADALAGAYGVINAASLYIERGQETFHSVHVEAARRVAAQAARAGVRTACSRLWDRCRLRLTIPVHPEAGRRRTGRPGCVRRCTFHPAGGDVRTGRRVSHHYRQAPSPASDLSDVRPRPDQIATGPRGRCCRSDCSGHATSRDAFIVFRARRPSHLLLRTISQSRCARSCACAPTDSNPVCRLARNGLGLREVADSRPHS